MVEANSTSALLEYWRGLLEPVDIDELVEQLLDEHCVWSLDLAKPDEVLDHLFRSIGAPTYVGTGNFDGRLGKEASK